VREINSSNATNSIYWDGRDNFGKEVSSGMYFVQVIGADFKEKFKIIKY